MQLEFTLRDYMSSGANERDPKGLYALDNRVLA